MDFEAVLDIILSSSESDMDTDDETSEERRSRQIRKYEEKIAPLQPKIHAASSSFITNCVLLLTANGYAANTEKEKEKHEKYKLNICTVLYDIIKNILPDVTRVVIWERLMQSLQESTSSPDEYPTPVSKHSTCPSATEELTDDEDDLII